MKNSRLIFSMSLPQRIKLITSAEQYKSRSMDGYDFPPMEFLRNPLQDKNVRATDFPSDCALACAFNPEITAKVYSCIGNEAKASVPFAYYDIDNRADGDENVKDPFIFAKAAQSKTTGLNAAGMFVNYNDKAQADDNAQEHIDSRLITDTVMRGSEPDSVTVRDPETASRYAEYNVGSLMFGFARDKEETARCLQSGYSFVFLESDFTDELIPYLIGLTEEYKKAVDACARGKITPEKIDMCCEELAMLPEERINEACDRVIDRLIALSKNGKEAVSERLCSLGKEAALFDEPLHDGIALEAARQSAVLIKNDGILPMEHEKKVAVLGEYAKKKEYHNSGNNQTAPYLPFEVINDFDIETVGYAHGYRSGEPLGSDLWTTARRLCNKADLTFVFLSARQGERVLPTEQLDLINALHDNGIKTVAIVASDGMIDLSFADKCNAVLLTHRGGQKSAHAVFEIITGFTSPSGRLPYSVPVHVEPDGSTSGGIRYPLGYGLSYTAFTYEKLKITDAGVSFTVRNTGDKDGLATLFMHVRKKATEDKPAGERYLRGFAKIFVPAHGTEKVEIPFGEETFRSYDFPKKQYRVFGGSYIITIGETESKAVLAGEITVRNHIFDDERSHSFMLEHDRNAMKVVRSFADTEDRRAYFMRDYTIPAGVSIFLAAFIALYIDVSAVLLFVFGLLPKSVFAYIAAVIVAAVIDIVAVVCCVVSVKRRKKAQNSNPPILDETVAGLSNFKELAYVTYEKPITREEIEDEEESASEEEESEDEDEEIPVYTYDTGFTAGVRQNIAFRNGISFSEICDNFRNYMLGWGIDLAPSSVRAFFAAIAASKIVFVQVNHKDLLPNFLIALGSYFQGADVVDVLPEWKTPNDLYWTLKDNKYMASGFTNSIYAAERTPDKNAVSILNHVRTENLRDWFGDIIRFALFPSERHVVRLNETTQAELPHNLCYLLFTEEECDGLPADVAAASMQVHMGMSAAESIGDPVEIKPVSLRAFDDLVRDAREEYFLSENTWKKLDEFTEAVCVKERFGFGNKIIQQMEKFGSVLLACGADESEAFSKMFTSKIVAMLKTLNIYKEVGGDKTLFGMIEKLFADENLTKIRKALMKASAKAAANKTDTTTEGT